MNDITLTLEYLKKNKPSQYEILDELESKNEELKIEGLNIIKKIPIMIEEHPIKSMLVSKL